MSYEEWLEIRMAFNKEVEMLKALYKENPYKFWRYPNVGKCSERMRAYLDKTKEIEGEGGWWSE